MRKLSHWFSSGQNKSERYAVYKNSKIEILEKEEDQLSIARYTVTIWQELPKFSILYTSLHIDIITIIIFLEKLVWAWYNIYNIL